MKKVIEISRKEFEILKDKPQTLIVDVREVDEFKVFNIGGTNVPPHELNEYLNNLSQYLSLIVVCSNGTRSHIIAQVIAKKLPQVQIYHLSEGIF